MKKEDIIVLPNPHLRERSRKIFEVNDDVRKSIEEMTSAALDWEDSRPHEISAALAAVQVDKLERIVIVRTDFDDKENREFTALINPEIVKYEGEVESDFEGCLSVKNIYGRVPRHTKIRIKALDIDGNPVKFKAEGFLARVIQHEIDHTKGIVFVDHIRYDKEAFYKLDSEGELKPVDYDKSITNSDLFDD